MNTNCKLNLQILDADKYFSIKMSLIWKIGLYNKLKVSEEAECLECKRIGKTKFKFSCKGGTTSTLLHHLRQHPGYEKQFYEIKFEDQQASAAKLMLLDQTESKSSLSQYFNG